MELLEHTAETVERLLGHGDAPTPVSLPLGAWAVALASDGLALATGSGVFDSVARIAIGAGLVGTAGAMATGAWERRSDGVTFAEHKSGVAAHAAGAMLSTGLLAASFVMRAGGRPSRLARGLALAGGGIALANALLTRRIGHHDEHGRPRLDPRSPLGIPRPTHA
jgi:uncharacterized membrane protein